MTVEFYGLGMGVPDPGPLAFVKASGRRKFYVQERAEIRDIEATEDHQDLMGKLAERAVRWFAEQAVEVEWHTLQFSVVGTQVDEKNREIAQLWRWEVWVS